MGGTILGLQPGSIFAWTAFFARWRRRWPIETAIGFEAAQDPDTQATPLAPQPVGIIATIQHDESVLGQVSNQTFELDKSHFDGRRLRRYSLLIQHVGPTPRFFRQDHSRRKLPAKGDGFLAFWQVMDMLCGPICRGHRIRTRNLARIDPNPQPLASIRFGQVANEDVPQVLFINTTILKSLIQARPFSFKPERLRHFWKRFGLGFAHQGIHGVEQRISTSRKTVIDIVTKLSQYVNVHLRKAPWNLLPELYLIGRPSARLEGLLS